MKKRIVMSIEYTVTTDRKGLPQGIRDAE